MTGWDEWLWDAFGSQIDQLRRMFAEQRYGCWCGPGNTCSDVEDDIDACCQQHDIGYGNVAVTSDDPPPSGWYNMWSAEGFIRTKDADATLASCVQATLWDTNFYGPTAAVYRESVQLIFGGRAAIAAALEAAGYTG